jgi:hypothetical protein
MTEQEYVEHLHHLQHARVGWKLHEKTNNTVKFSIKRRENNALYVENSVDASPKEVY